MALARLSRSWRGLASAHYIRRSVPATFYSSIPTDVEQATGLEKKELDALMAGVEDPFNLSVNKGPWGTRDKPTMVPSMLGERLVGCICEEDATFVNWMKLKKGPAQRCECGHWFQLFEGKSTKV